MVLVRSRASSARTAKGPAVCAAIAVGAVLVAGCTDYSGSIQTQNALVIAGNNPASQYGVAFTAGETLRPGAMLTLTAGAEVPVNFTFSSTATSEVVAAGSFYATYPDWTTGYLDADDTPYYFAAPTSEAVFFFDPGSYQMTIAAIACTLPYSKTGCAIKSALQGTTAFTVIGPPPVTSAVPRPSS